MFGFNGVHRPKSGDVKSAGMPPNHGSSVKRPAEVRVEFVPDAFADTLERLVDMADARADALRATSTNRKLGTDYHNLAKLIDSCREFAKEKGI